MTKAAVFDLDGVLLDSMGIWNDLGARYLRSLGITPEEGLNEILFSMSMEQGAEYLHTHYALPQSAAEVGAGIADMLRDFYFYEVPAKDGAAALLAALTARGVKLGGDILYLFQDQRVEEGATSDGTGTCIPLRHGKIQFEPYRSGTYEPYGQNDVYHL